MDAELSRTLARLIAWGRVAIGVTATVVPTLVSRPWVGPAADGVAPELLARATGGRDLAMGIGTLRALRVSDHEGRPWVALGGVADAADVAATLLAFRELPTRLRWAILALAAGSAAVSVRAAAGLDSRG